MKNRLESIAPAEAGYFTTRQWESAFEGAFETLRRDRDRGSNRGAALQPAESPRLKIVGKAFGFSLSTTSKKQRPAANDPGGNSRW